MCTVIIDTVIIILVLLVRVGCPCSRSEATSTKQWVNTDKESEIDDKDRHHPEDDDDHHLNGGDRPSLMLAHTAGAELVNLVNDAMFRNIPSQADITIPVPDRDPAQALPHAHNHNLLGSLWS